MSLHVGQTLGDYRIVSLIGAGSLGQVFQVEHQITKRREALKVLPDCANSKQVRRFQREIEVLSSLDHPNIARAYNALQLEDCLVLVMEFVEGQTLEQILRQGRISADTGVDYIRQTLCALRYAHDRGVIHRDLTPSNLIINPSGRVKLTDFGVAKSVGDWQLTNGGEFVGSLAYMAPEQLRGHADPDPRSDIYSAAAILYEIVTGKKPFDYPNRLSLMVAQVQRDPIRPSEIDPAISPQLEEVILTAMAKDPKQRYQSAAEFLTAISGAEEPPIAPLNVIRRVYLSPQVRVGAATLAIFSLAGVGSLGKGTPSPHPSVAPPSVRHTAVIQTVALQPVTPSAPPPANTQTRISSRQGPRRSAKLQAADQSKQVTQEPAAEPVTQEAAPQDAAAQEAGTQEAPQESVMPDSQPQETAGPPAPETSRPAKKRFWSRLNPFKRKKSD
jgi:serine/threonine-protein kinase